MREEQTICYESVNRMLYVCTPYFVTYRQRSPIIEVTIRSEQQINSVTNIAVVNWNTIPPTRLIAPHECYGLIVKRTNGRIAQQSLCDRPAQWLAYLYFEQDTARYNHAIAIRKEAERLHENGNVEDAIRTYQEQVIPLLEELEAERSLVNIRFVLARLAWPLQHDIAELNAHSALEIADRLGMDEAATIRAWLTEARNSSNPM